MAGPAAAVANLAFSCLEKLPSLFAPMIGMGPYRSRFIPALYAAAIGSAVMAFRIPGKRRLLAAAALSLLLVSTGSLGIRSGARSAAEAMIPEGTDLMAGNGILVIEGDLTRSRARRIVSALLATGLRSVERTILTSCSMVSAEGAAELRRYLEVDTLYCCRFIRPLIDEGFGGRSREGAVIAVEKPLRIGEGGGSLMISPKIGQAGPSPLEESGLDIYPLDLDSEGG